MNSKKTYYSELQFDAFYHVYNRSISDTDLFFNESNYKFFLKRLDEYLSPYLEMYAWALIPNHFHLLVRIRNPHEYQLQGTEVSSLNELNSAFRRFFQSYAQSINLQERRKGPLFESAFKRKLVDSPDYFTQLIYYIHSNPQILINSCPWPLHPLSNIRTFCNRTYRRFPDISLPSIAAFALNCFITDSGRLTFKRFNGSLVTSAMAAVFWSVSRLFLAASASFKLTVITPIRLLLSLQFLQWQCCPVH